MVEKVRDIISNLNELGDNVKADEIFSVRRLPLKASWLS